MSSHRRLVKHFSRKSGPRKALLRGLMVSLVEHGRIKTTVTKAKEVRRHIERIITLGKKDNLNSIRLIASRLSNPDAAVDLVKSIAPRFKERAGGYTRVTKIGRRPGDCAEMAFLEFVDYDWKNQAGVVSKKETPKKTDKAGLAVVKVASKAKKISFIQESKDKKSVRKMKNSSRAYAFATR